MARRLAELEPANYASLENLGICVIDAGGESAVATLAKLYRDLGKRTFGACDRQTDGDKAAIEAQVEVLYMHHEHGLEDLVLAQTTAAALQRFAALVTWPLHLVQRHGDPVANAAASLPDLFAWNKGGWGLADFLAQCTVAEVPQFLRDTCAGLRALCEAAEADEDAPPEGQSNAA